MLLQSGEIKNIDEQLSHFLFLSDRSTEDSEASREFEMDEELFYYVSSCLEGKFTLKNPTTLEEWETQLASLEELFPEENSIIQEDYIQPFMSERPVTIWSTYYEFCLAFERAANKVTFENIRNYYFPLCSSACFKKDKELTTFLRTFKLQAKEKNFKNERRALPLGKRKAPSSFGDFLKRKGVLRDIYHRNSLDGFVSLVGVFNSLKPAPIAGRTINEREENP